MIIDTSCTGPLAWHLRRCADAGTLPLVVRTAPLGRTLVMRAVGGEEPSATERRRIADVLARHAATPLSIPGAPVRDWAITIDTDGWRPWHRSERTKMGYESREAAEARVAELRAMYERRRLPVPPMRVVERRVRQRVE